MRSSNRKKGEKGVKTHQVHEVKGLVEVAQLEGLAPFLLVPQPHQLLLHLPQHVPQPVRRQLLISLNILDCLIP